MQYQTANEKALKESIADCMEGITANDITDLVAQQGSRKLYIRAESSSSILISYTVKSTTQGLNYDTTSSQLQQAVTSGQFDTFLTENAKSTPGAYDLVGCTSNSVTTENLQVASPSNSNDDELSGGAVAGIVIAVIFAVAVCFGAVWLFVFKDKQSASEPASAFTSASVPAQSRSASTSSRTSQPQTSADRGSSTSNWSMFQFSPSESASPSKYRTKSKQSEVDDEGGFELKEYGNKSKSRDGSVEWTENMARLSMKK